MNIRAVKDSLERLGELQRNGDPENYYQLSEKPFLEIQAKKDEDDDFTKPFDRIQVLQGTDRDEVLSHYKAMKKDLLKKGKTSLGSVDAFLFNKELEEKLHLRDPLEERDYRTISHNYYLNNKTHRAILEIERYNH